MNLWNNFYIVVIFGSHVLPYIRHKFIDYHKSRVNTKQTIIKRFILKIIMNPLRIACSSGIENLNGESDGWGDNHLAVFFVESRLNSSWSVLPGIYNIYYNIYFLLFLLLPESRLIPSSQKCVINLIAMCNSRLNIHSTRKTGIPHPTQVC